MTLAKRWLIQHSSWYDSNFNLALPTAWHSSSYFLSVGLFVDLVLFFIHPWHVQMSMPKQAHASHHFHN